jgi:cell division protein FtsW
MGSARGKKSKRSSGDRRTRGKGRGLSVSGARNLLIGAIIFLTLAGLVMVFSAAFVGDYVEHSDSAYTLKRQLAYVGIGLVLLAGLARLDYKRLWSLAWGAVVAADVALVAVLFVGVEHGGSTRWIDLGVATLQPSEFAKIACVLALAVVMTDGRVRDETQRLARTMAIVPPILVLVMFEPDMGTAMAILVTSFIVLWLGGLSWGKTFALAGVAGGFAALGIALAPYRMERWLAFADPWADPLGGGYQTVQAIYAFASGGLTGAGLGMSAQKFSYLPEAHTDFILAVIGEELGLLGTMTIVLAFIIVAVAGFRIALGAKDPFGRLLAGGMTTLVVSQAVINMLAVTNLMPVTGIPLPLVSFGGNSMLATMLAIGIVVSVSRYGAEPVAATSARAARGGGRARSDQRRRDGGARVSRARGGARARVGR